MASGDFLGRLADGTPIVSGIGSAVRIPAVQQSGVLHDPPVGFSTYYVPGDVLEKVGSPLVFSIMQFEGGKVMVGLKGSNGSLAWNPSEPSSLLFVPRQANASSS